MAGLSKVTGSGIEDGTLSVDDIADNAITEAKIADAAVVSLKSGRKNLIINGGFDVWQRGTSFSGVASNAYHADRWKIWSNGGTVDIDKVSGGLQLAISGTGVTASLMQDIEAQDVPLGDYILSFDADNYSNIVSANCYSIGGGTHYGNLTYISDGKYSMTLTSANFNSSTTAIRVEIYLNTNTTTVINNIQLELGSVATDFEHRSYGEELALCQRYFWATAFLNTGVYNTDTSVFCTLNAPVTFRTSPTVSMKSGTYTNINIEKSDAYDISNVSFGHGSTQAYYLANPLLVLTTPTRTGFAGQAGMVGCDQNNDAFFFDAEL